MGSGPKMIRFEFNSFLLKVADELTSSDFRKLKFVLKEFVPAAQSERTTEAFHYFEELQRQCLLSPTDFHMLKKAFNAIGRLDLVEELEAKEHQFGEQSQGEPKPGIYNKEDTVHDGELPERNGTNKNRPGLLCTTDGNNELELPDGPSVLAADNEAAKRAKPEPEEEVQHKKVNVKTDDIGIKEEDVADYDTTPMVYAEPGDALNDIEKPVNSEMLIEPSSQTKTTVHNEPSGEIIQNCVNDNCNALEQLSVSSGATVSDAYGKKSDEYSKESHKASPICNSAVGEMEEKPLQQGSRLSKGARAEVTEVPWPSLPACEQKATEQEDKGGAKTFQHGVVMPSKKKVTGHLAIINGASKSSKEPSEDDYSGEATVCGAFQAEASSSGGSQGPSFPAPLYKGTGGSFFHQEASLAPHALNAAGWAVKPTSYIKGNYSVRISPGAHFQSTEDMGVVIMESGQSYQIEITNQNEYAAEVDISNGGKFLGVWLVEARQSNPLVIQGSAWEEGRLTFFSATDMRRPPSQRGFEEATGKIELHFKPEAWRMFAQHVRMEQKYEILVTNFYTATVRDLKRNIEAKYGSEVACLIKNGNILDEEKTIRACNLNHGDIIQMLSNQEKLAVRAPDGRTITLQVDPRNFSTHRAMGVIECKLNLPLARRKHRLRFNGQDIEDLRSPVEIFLLSKEPVLQLEVDYPIDIRVRLPEGAERSVSSYLFATLQEFRNELVSQGICDRNAVLKFDGTEIKSVDGDESKPLLIDLGLENNSTVTVQPAKAKRSILRGFDSSFASYEAEGFEGFGEHEDYSCGPPFQRSNLLLSPRCSTFFAQQDFSPGNRRLRGGGSGFESDHGFISEFSEGRAVLMGTERFGSKFTVDSGDRRFSEEGSVTLVIQLVSRDSTSIGSRPSVQYPLQPRPTRTGPMSTPCPPPVPE